MSLLVVLKFMNIFDKTITIIKNNNKNSKDHNINNSIIQGSNNHYKTIYINENITQNESENQSKNINQYDIHDKDNKETNNTNSKCLDGKQNRKKSWE